jgi:hypothetical protein
MEDKMKGCKTRWEDGERDGRMEDEMGGRMEDEMNDWMIRLTD